MKILRLTVLATCMGVLASANASFEMLLVLDAGTKSIHRFDPQSGAYLGAFGAGWLNNPQSIILNQAKGQCYVMDKTGGAGTGVIMAFDYNSGERVGGIVGNMAAQSGFVQMAQNPANGEITTIGGSGANQVQRYSIDGTLKHIGAAVNDPGQIAFGPDGNLYLGASVIDQVFRYTPTLDFLGISAATVNFDDGQMTFGGSTPKGYFATGFSRVMGFDYNTFAFTQINMTDFSSTKGVAFGHGDVLFTCGLNAAGTDGQIGRFDVKLGVAGGTFGSAQLTNPVSLACVVAPEPSTWLVSAAGLALLIRRRRR